MSYTALYRKWRPAVFEDVKGQDSIVKTLKNQIVTKRVGHAYLFCGTRGTGKTSIAKIFAKAVNCEQPVDGSPCNECRICQNITRGSSLDVMEIDAASNNGVENIREIREQVQYPPTEGTYRVYIIDEVHMLSTGAFNALLKTLEEPPSYVVFILATTEAHKIPITVLSRCQRYDFKRINVQTMTEHLEELTEAEGIQVDDKALAYIAKAADGAMRDALSLLDQCSAFYFGQRLTYDNVLEVLGAVDTEVFSRMLSAVVTNQTVVCIHILEEMVVLGRELSQFVTDFIWYLRNLLVIKTADDTESLLDVSEENKKLMLEGAGRIEEDTLIRYIRVLSELSNQLRYASQKRVLIEIALIKLTRPAMEQDLNSILQRVKQIEKQLEEGLVIWKADSEQNVVRTTNGDAENELPKQMKLPKARLEDLNRFREDWNKILRSQGGVFASGFRNVVLEPGGESELCIVCMDENTFAMGKQFNVTEKLIEYAKQTYEKQMEFKIRLKEGTERLDTVYVTDEDLEVIHTEIIVE